MSQKKNKKYPKKKEIRETEFANNWQQFHFTSFSLRLYLHQSSFTLESS